ncbi:MAG TPA: response regulator transcription factor [Vicinamibacterales bacterium]|nr:response regulator transcription factor [Vicinamibacterales bacterium]
MTSETRCIRVLIVDDHRIVREGLAMVIDRQADMHVTALAADADDALQRYLEHRPDLTIMDLQLGATSGVTAIKAIRAHDPSARIVVLTMMKGDEDIYRAMEAGAATYLLKDTAIEDLARVIREVHAGRSPRVSPEIRAQMVARAERPALTHRETQVLELVRRGLRNREIGISLGISEETVQSHVRSVLSKLDVQDRTAAVDVALRRGILHLQ